MEVKGETLGKLVQAGFIAGFRGYKKEAQTIFEGIHACRPDNVDVLIGLALSVANNLKFEEAIGILKHRVLKQEPGNAMAKCFLGSVLLRAGKHVEGKQILSEIAESDSGDNVALARSMLDEHTAARNTPAEHPF